MDVHSAPLTLSRSASSDSSISLDYLDFYLTPYLPLSNLPTPPSSPDGGSRQPVVADTDLGIEEDEVFDPDLLGPAHHLCNLVPPNTSISRPSPRLIHAFLSRVELPIETIALAACILDNLSTRFTQAWRRECLNCPSPSPSPLPSPPQSPLQPLELVDTAPNEYSTSLTAPAPSHSTQPLKPDLIILVALLLSSHLHTDGQCENSTPAHYAIYISNHLFSCRQINATTRAMLQDLDYRLEPLGREDMVREMVMEFRKYSGRGREHGGCVSGSGAGAGAGARMARSGRAEGGLAE
ncbi:MAG: hypothetical protein M1819_007463 [Sarea resinae]|nr:MAG: hypothetical protein M1819_007463 [Sarea resinae]